MNTEFKKTLPTIVVVFFSNPEHIMPLFDAINLLSKRFKVIVVHRNSAPLNYKYSENVFICKVGHKLKLGENSSTIRTVSEYFVFICKIRSIIKDNYASILLCYDMNAFVSGWIASRFLHKLFVIYYQLETVLLTEIPIHRLAYWIKRLEIFFVKSVDKLIFTEPNRARLFLQDAHLNKDFVIIENCPRKLSQMPKCSSLLQGVKEKGNRIVLHRGPIGDGSTLDIHPTIRSIKFWPTNTVFVIQGFRLPQEENACKRIIEEENLQQRILFLPFIQSYIELLEIVACADVGLVLYKPVEINRKHANPVKLYDYIACGVPTVVPKVMTFISEMVNQLGVGLSYLESTPESIGQAIREVLEHNDWKKMAERARKEHLETLNFEYQFSKLLNEIEKVTNKELLKVLRN